MKMGSGKVLEEVHGESDVRKYIRLPNGQNMPVVGLGLWLADNYNQLEKAIECALEAGYRHFDTAAFYGNEHILGKVLSSWIRMGKIRREDLFVVTKLPWTGMTVDKVQFFFNLSLNKLQLDYVDLYLCHLPVGLKFLDETNFMPKGENGEFLFEKGTDLVAIWREMESLAEMGKAKSIGVSNYNERQLEKIMKIARIPPANLQVEMHVYFQNRSLRACAAKHNVSVCAYAPLGSPGRSDHTDVKLDIPNLLEDSVVLEIAKKHNKTSAQILLRFLVQQEVIVVPKSTNEDRLKQNINIFDFKLTNVDMRRLEGLDKGEKGRSFTGFPGWNQHPESPWKQ